MPAAVRFRTFWVAIWPNCKAQKRALRAWRSSAHLRASKSDLFRGCLIPPYGSETKERPLAGALSARPRGLAEVGNEARFILVRPPAIFPLCRSAPVWNGSPSFDKCIWYGFGRCKARCKAYRRCAASRLSRVGFSPAFARWRDLRSFDEEFVEAPALCNSAFCVSSICIARRRSAAIIEQREGIDLFACPQSSG